MIFIKELLGMFGITSYLWDEDNDPGPNTDPQ